MTTASGDFETSASPTKTRLMLVDSHALVHRAFHAMPEFTTTTGELTNAVFGWTSMVLKAIADLRPTHVIVAFDYPARTFRHEAYEGYKATRPRTPRPLALQFDRVRQMAGVFRMPIIEAQGFEADDILGTLARQAEEQGVESVIVTGDLDTLQLVDENVTVLTTRRQTNETILYDIAGVNQRFGIRPEQLPDLKGLIGDTSDNIPVIRGVGEKTASKLLAQYDSLEGIYEHLDEVPPRFHDLLRDGREQAFKSRTLATIVTAPVQLNLDEAVLQDFDMPTAVALFRELEFRSLLSRLAELRPEARPSSPADDSRQDGQLSFFSGEPSLLAADGLAASEASRRVTEVDIVTTGDGLDRLVAALGSATAVAIDVEAEGGHSVDCDIVGIALSTKEEGAFYVPLGHVDQSQMPAIEVLQRLAPFLEDDQLPKIGYDLKQAHLVLGSHGVSLKGLHCDIMLASYLENSSGRLLALDTLAYELMGLEVKTRDELVGKGRKQIQLRELPLADLGAFAGAISDVSFRLSTVLRERLRHRNLLNLLDSVEMPLISVLSDMERAGVSLNCELLMEMSHDLTENLTVIEQRIFDRVGHGFNVNSPPQLGEVLFGEMKLKKGRRTKTGWSTDNEVLEKLRGEEPIVDDVLEYRQLSKLKGTYVDALPALISRRDGRLHAEFNQAVAATGRLSSSNPNLQNIPIRSEIGHRIRQAFIPASPEALILAADYSQIELRVLAHLSEDERLVEAFNSNQDIHAVTAAAVWNVPTERVVSEQRRIAKVVNFGIAYGIGEQRLAYETGLTRQEAAAFIESYRKTYAGVTDFMETVRSQAYLYGQVSTLLGRVRSLPDIHSNHPGVRQAAERAAINMPVQGTAADIIKIAMINIATEMAQRGLRSTMILQVHDELVFEVPRVELDVMATLVHDLMASAVALNVPLGVDVNVGPNWGQLERYAKPV